MGRRRRVGSSVSRAGSSRRPGEYSPRESWPGLGRRDATRRHALPFAAMPDEPTATTPSPRSAGTRSRSSSASATRRPRARPSSGPARRPGRRRSTGSTTTRWSARWASPPATRSCAAPTSGRPAEPGPAPVEPATLQAVLDEFATRIAPHTLNSYHPRALSYFTPPPLVASIVGEVLAQWTNQGVDVWHAGPVAAFVEEEVVRWLCDLVGYGEGSFGLLTSGGVMANFIALALVRDVHLRALTGAARPPRGAALEGVRVYASDQAHFSIARALDELGFPPETLVARARPTTRSGSTPRRSPRRSPGIAPRACGRSPSPPSPGSTNTGSVDLVPELAALAAARGPVAARRRGVRRRGPPVRPRRRPGARPPPRRQRHDRPPQVVLPGLRRRRAARPRRAATCAQAFDRSPEYYRGGEAAVGAGRRSRRPRRRRRRPRRPAQLLQARLRGDPPLPGAQAVGDLEAPRHERPRPAHRAQRRHRRVPGRPLRRGRRPRGAPRAARAQRRVLPSPAGRARRPRTRWHPRTSTRTRTASRRRSSSPATAGCRRPRSAAGPGCAPGIVNYLTGEADIDRLLATLRRLA